VHWLLHAGQRLQQLQQSQCNQQLHGFCIPNMLSECSGERTVNGAILQYRLDQVLHFNCTHRLCCVLKATH
jgi:hypothetical protein